jgi:carbamoyltransferase
MTGVYCLLNTSFNIRGEPIVNRPEEAIECYLQTGMDALFLEGYLLQKNESR